MQGEGERLGLGGRSLLLGLLPCLSIACTDWPWVGAADAGVGVRKGLGRPGTEKLKLNEKGMV